MLAAAAPAPVDQIPRQPGVSDGAWDAADAAVVRVALRDGQQAASTSGRTGEAPCRAPSPACMNLSQMTLSMPLMHALRAGPEVLLGRSLPELQRFAQERGQPAYRGKQLYDGLLHGVHSVLEFNNVRARLRSHVQ